MQVEEIKPDAVGFDPQAARGPPKLTDDEVQALLTVWRNDPDFERKVDAVLFVHGTVFILDHKLDHTQ